MPSHEAQHVVMLDLDHDAVLIPSSTPGHHHLILNMAMGWSDYKDLLSTLAETGVIEPDYFDASVRRGETFLRLPWIRKAYEADDARATIDEWLDADDRDPELQGPEALEQYLQEEASCRPAERRERPRRLPHRSVVPAPGAPVRGAQQRPRPAGADHRPGR